LTARLAAYVWSRPLEPGASRDAVEVRLPSHGEAGGIARLAIADGASGTLFSGRWAAALVAAAVEDWPGVSTGSPGDWLEALRSTFTPMPVEPRPTPLRAEKWQLYGSQSTLLAVRVARHRGSLAVEAVGVGDSVLLLLGRTSWQVIPEMASQDFTATPHLLRSTPGVDHEFFRWAGGVPGSTVLLLATDGAAQPLLRILETDGPAEARAVLAGILSGPFDGSEPVGEEDLSVMPRAREFLANLHDDATIVALAKVPDRLSSSDAELILAALAPEPDAVGRPAKSEVDGDGRSQATRGAT
jgi:hypothetical protein